jgi:hypothetical protein
MEDIAQLYRTLELEPGATSEEIKAAYLDMVKVWHPDRYQHESQRLRDKAAQKLTAVNLAYERLRGASAQDQAEAVRQNAEPRNWETPDPRPESPIVTPIDLFAYDFGRAWGYVDRDGKLLIRPQFDIAEQFSEGLAHVSEFGRHGFINWKGEYVIRPGYLNARSFSEGLAAVVFSHRWGYIDRFDRYVITPLFDEAFAFSEGMAAVLWRGRWGFLEKSGKYAIPPRFDEARRFVRGVAEVRIGDRWGEVNRSGEIFFAGKAGDLT